MPRLPAVWLPCWEHHPWPRPPWPPAVQGFPDAHKFDPDRMGPERKEDVHHAKNFLTFGYGPHYCVGECKRGGAGLLYLLLRRHDPREEPAGAAAGLPASVPRLLGSCGPWPWPATAPSAGLDRIGAETDNSSWSV